MFVIGRNDMLCTIRDSYMLPVALPTTLIQFRNDMELSSSNGCLSLQHIITFPLLREYLKTEYLYEIWDLLLAEATHCGSLGAGIFYQKLFQPSVYIWGRLWNTSLTIYTSPHSMASHFMCWEGAQNLKFAWNLMFVIGRNDMLGTIRF